jgi:thiol:disulfide interchange protein
MNYDSEGANWAELMGNNGAKIDLNAIRSHKWLIVDYGASWSAPCVVLDKQLTQILASEKRASDYVWITVDMTRVPDVKDAAKASSGQGQ